MRKFICGLVIAAVLVSTISDAQAQRRSSGVASLGEMGCQTIGGEGRYRVRNEDIPIGREILRAVASLGNFYGDISKSQSLGVACRLAPVNAAPPFKTLTLSFGLRQNDDYLDGSVIVRLSVYKDGNFYGEQTISMGDKIRWPIDVRNTRSVSLETECVRSMQYRSDCPGIWFVEDILRK